MYLYLVANQKMPRKIPILKLSSLLLANDNLILYEKVLFKV